MRTYQPPALKDASSMSTNAAIWGAGEPRTIGFLTLLSRAATAVERIRAKRRTARVLGELDDHVLVDIGINPGEVLRHRQSVVDWIVQSHNGTARIVFIGR
jgi:uncharacterized protein YjiS (DUF1127 family)